MRFGHDLSSSREVARSSTFRRRSRSEVSKWDATRSVGTANRRVVNHLQHSFFLGWLLRFQRRCRQRGRRMTVSDGILTLTVEGPATSRRHDARNSRGGPGHRCPQAGLIDGRIAPRGIDRCSSQALFKMLSEEARACQATPFCKGTRNLACLSLCPPGKTR